MCKYRHSSPLEQYPLRTKKLHSGILRRLYSCRNSQCSPFLQRARSQCLHTSELKPPEVVAGAAEEEEEDCVEVDVGSRAWLYVRLRKGEKLNVYRGVAWVRICWARSDGVACGGAGAMAVVAMV